MPLKKWCECVAAHFDETDMTVEEWSSKCDTSEKTLNRLLRYASMTDEEFGKAEINDIYRETALRIENSLFGVGCPDPCLLTHDEADRTLERAIADNAEYRAEIENILLSHSAEVRALQEDADQKIAFLKTELERAWQINSTLCRELDNLWQEKKNKS